MFLIAKKSLIIVMLQRNWDFLLILKLSLIFYWYFAHFNLIIIASLSNLNFSNGHIQTV